MDIITEQVSQYKFASNWHSTLQKTAEYANNKDTLWIYYKDVSLFPCDVSSLVDVLSRDILYKRLPNIW